MTHFYKLAETPDDKGSSKENAQFSQAARKTVKGVKPDAYAAANCVFW